MALLDDDGRSTKADKSRGRESRKEAKTLEKEKEGGGKGERIREFLMKENSMSVMG